MSFAALILASAVAIPGITGCAHIAPLNKARFLYVVDCEARVDKLDTVEGKCVATIELAERSGHIPRALSAHAERCGGVSTR